MVKSDLTELSLEILRKLSQTTEITRITYEGPAIAIYTKSPEIFLENPTLISELATQFKKRLLLRSEPEVRLGGDETIDIIYKVLEAIGIRKDDIRVFIDSIRGEVHIYVPRYIGGEEVRKATLEIVKKTKWIPRFRIYYREVPEVFKKIYSALYIGLKNRVGQKILSSVGDRIFRVPLNPSKDIRVTGLGGVEEVGRSAFVIETTESKILIDLGIKVNASRRVDYAPRIDAIDFLLNELDAVILSHSHLDHSGLIPILYKYGYRGPVYMTEPSLPLTVLLQTDFIDIAKKSGFNPLYNENDIREMIRHTITLKYNQVTDVAPDIKLTFFNAGHILGSAMIHLHIVEGVYNILYTGDFKFGYTRLLDPATTDFTRVETLIIESTYGGRNDILRPRKEEESFFSKEVKSVLDRKGKVLIPTPAVGRAQEMLSVLHYLIRKEVREDYKLPEVPVYIDGMIDDANKIHITYLDYLKHVIRNEFKEAGENPFYADYIVTVDKPSVREEVIRDPGPAIILSTSGMLQGGPVIEYLKHLADDPRNALIFVSYQAENTLGRRIVDGERQIDLIDEGRVITVNINMDVKKFDGFTGHSDRRQLLGFVSRLKHLLKNVYVVHGEPSKIKSLSSTITSFFEVPAGSLELLESMYLK